MLFKTLALIYTWKCNATCASCCYSCSPKRVEKLSLLQALSLIEETTHIEEIQHLSISGGEPFLYLDEIKILLEELNKTGRTSNCVTNAFWASTPEKAIDILKDLKRNGLTTLSLSYDSYHEKFVPVKHITNALHAAKSLEINIELNCSRGINDPHLVDILPSIEEVNGKLQEGILVPAGRAASLPSEVFAYQDTAPLKRCGMLNAITVFPNGTVYPCCSVFGESSFLAIGNIQESSLKEILEDAHENPLLLIMERQGFGVLIDLGKKIDPNMSLPSKTVNPCHFCHELFANSQTQEAILKGVLQFEREFYEKRRNIYFFLTNFF